MASAAAQQSASFWSERGMDDPENDKKWAEYQKGTGEEMFTKSGSIVLIGIRQSGKSSLANFLVRGEKTPRGEKRLFKMGRGLEPTTTVVQKVQTNWTMKLQTDKAQKSKNLKAAHAFVNIIDTPGVGDNADREACQYKNIFTNLREMDANKQGVSLVALVVQFKSLISERYIANVKAYQEMFPRIFSQNAVLIITNFKSDREWQEDQAYNDDGLTATQMYKQMAEEITEKLGLPHSIAVMTINSIPYDDDDLEMAIKVRNNLMHRVLMTQPVRHDPTSPHERTFPKPPCWKHEDELEAAKAQAKIKGYQDALKDEEHLFKAACEELSRASDAMCAAVEEHKQQQDRLNKLDSSETLVSLEDVVVQKHRNWLPTFVPFSKVSNKQDYEYAGEFPITKYKYAGEKRPPTVTQPQPNHIKVTFHRKFFFQNLCVSLQLFTTAKNYNAVEINALKESIIPAARERAREATAWRDRIRDEKSEIDSRFAKYAELVRQCEETSKKLKAVSLTYDEFKARIEASADLRKLDQAMSEGIGSTQSYHQSGPTEYKLRWARGVALDAGPEADSDYDDVEEPGAADETTD